MLDIVDASSCAVMASIGSAGVDPGLSHTKPRHIAIEAPLASDQPDPAEIRIACVPSSDPEFLERKMGFERATLTLQFDPPGH
jgi:hypothetical protein